MYPAAWSQSSAARSAGTDPLLNGLAGLVLEVGAGLGDGFTRYPVSVRQVVAVDVDDTTRAAARAIADQLGGRVSVVAGFPDALPIDDGLCDAGVVSLALCSVPHPVHALFELRRVIRPGGELRYREHVRARNAALGHLQDLVDRPWRTLTGGCHLNRVTSESIRAAGFEILWERRFRAVVGDGLVTPVVLGAARGR